MRYPGWFYRSDDPSYPTYMCWFFWGGIISTVIAVILLWVAAFRWDNFTIFLLANILAWSSVSLSGYVLFRKPIWFRSKL